jgi:hypothetical protein
MKKTNLKIAPFENESESLNIGGLNIENRNDRIAIYGSIDITRDRLGLAHARTLKTLFDDIVTTMSASPLPEKISIKPADDVQNPFAD